MSTSAPEQVGRYRLVRRIGRGGMAEVLEALAIGDHSFERRVALKRMLERAEPGSSFARMFLDEARIASRLHHANIVAVLDYGVIDDVPFQALELVDGLDARDLLTRSEERGKHFPVTVALHVCTEVAHALDYAHHATDAEGKSLGIVHRDVSPENVLIAWSGDVKLADFGIALAHNRAEQTRAGDTKGKLVYMAPEQAMHTAIDGRTDVFSLGCVLHVLLTGASPLSREDSMVDLIAGSELELDPSLDDDVRSIIRRAIHPSKTKRFESAGAMAEAMGKALAQRIDRDPKTMMRDWLAEFGEAKKRLHARGLDEALHLELVLTDPLANRTPGSARRFESRATEPAIQTPPTTSAAREPLVPVRTTSRSRVALQIGLAAVVAAAGGTLFAVVLARRSTSPTLPAPIAVHDRAPRSVAPSPTLGPGTPSLMPTPSLTPVAEHVEVSSTVSPSPHHRLRPGASATPELLASPRAAADERTGFVVFGGLGANRAEIIVDGQSRGYAPKRLELPLGTHSLHLRAPDGHELGPPSFTLTPLHDLDAPLRVIVQ